MRRAFFLALWLGLTAGAAMATDCRSVNHDAVTYTVCSVDPAADLRLFLNDRDARPYGHFTALDRALADQGLQLAFAMNAGMYHPDRRPVGLYVENRTETAPLQTRASLGNFGLLPNGVFCIGNGRAQVIETRTYAAARPDCRDATQSGPMLVIDGALHPRFLPDSTSRYVRNGVGVDTKGQVHFAISEARVTFHQFGRFFRDVLMTPQALYLDGSISRLHAPGLARSDPGFAMGPIVGVVIPR